MYIRLFTCDQFIGACYDEVKYINLHWQQVHRKMICRSIKEKWRFQRKEQREESVSALDGMNITPITINRYLPVSRTNDADSFSFHVRFEVATASVYIWRLNRSEILKSRISEKEKSGSWKSNAINACAFVKFENVTTKIEVVIEREGK